MLGVLPSSDAAPSTYYLGQSRNTRIYKLHQKLAVDVCVYISSLKIDNKKMKKKAYLIC